MGIIILILIAIIGYFVYQNYCLIKESPYKCLLSGFWKAPPSYLIESDTELITLYLEENLVDGWFIIKKEDGYILNDPIELKLVEIPLNNKKRVLKYECYFGLESSEFPNNQTMLFYPECGKIIFYKNDRIYAILYKDCELTENAMENHFDIKAENIKKESPAIQTDDMGESLYEDEEDLN